MRKTVFNTRRADLRKVSILHRRERMIMTRASDEGLIYYVLDATGREQRLKIGFSTNLKARLVALASQTMSRQTPIVLAIELGSINEEHERHAQFAEYRLIGEWFAYEGALEKYVRDLPHPISWLHELPQHWRYCGGWQGFVGWQSPDPASVSCTPDGVVEF